MNFVADESCAKPVIQALREAGHEVIAVAEVAKGAPDDQVFDLALKAKRVLITEDRDFGELVYARGRASSGVMLVRFPSHARHTKAATVAKAVSMLGARLEDTFTVVEPGQRNHLPVWADWCSGEQCPDVPA
jgi:predicted nuclease of predicted toxin-antitoxin system